MSASAETVPGLAFPILIGDIGGTNARFALLNDETSEPVVFPVVPTGGYPSIQAALEIDERFGRPQTLSQFVAGDEIARPIQQRPENLKRLIGKTDPNPAPAQLAAPSGRG